MRTQDLMILTFLSELPEHDEEKIKGEHKMTYYHYIKDYNDI
jgi:hypothetical protein